MLLSVLTYGAYISPNYRLGEISKALHDEQYHVLGIQTSVNARETNETRTVLGSSARKGPGRSETL